MKTPTYELKSGLGDIMVQNRSRPEFPGLWSVKHLGAIDGCSVLQARVQE